MNVLLHRLLLLCLVCLSGCAAPLLQDDGRVRLDVAAVLEAARPVEVICEDGCTLRGDFVEASPDAPVVLHLLPASVSVTNGISNGIGRHSLGHTLRSFADAGWSSLVLDYRGMGDSSGQRNADRLALDGTAMWRAAVQHAGGREDRVVIRAASLGTLVAVELLNHGVRPRGVVLIAPVRSETVVKHGARRKAGPLFGGIASMFYKRPIGAGLVEALQKHSDIPMLVILPELDQHVSADELQMIAEASRAGGHALVEAADDHPVVVLRAWGFKLNRREFSGRGAPELLDEEAAFLDQLK